MDSNTRYQDTHTLLDGKPFIIRHKQLNPIRNSISLHTFLSKIDYLSTSSDSPAVPPNRQNLVSCPTTSTQMLKTLYSFALEPKWATHFFPENAFNQIDQLHLPNGDPIPITTLPKVGPSFSLVKAQGEEAVEYGQNRRGKPCGHVFEKGEGVYHCSDCGLDTTCALCSKCFHASDHVGHDVIYSIHTTGCGCCDCGDTEAWKTEINCKYHSNLTLEEKEEALKKLEEDKLNEVPGSKKTYLNPLPKECKDVIEQIVTIALDFLLITLDRSPEDMTPPNSVDNIYSELSRIEENAYLEMPRNSFSSSDDSMDIDTQYSHHHNPYHLQNAPPAEDPGLSTPTNRSTALWDNKGQEKGKGKSIDASTSTATPVAPPPTPATFGIVGKVGQFEVLRGPGEGTDDEWSKWRNHDERLPEEKPKGAGPWGLVLWNDEKHSYAQVIDQVSRATGCSRREALEIANRVDSKGRDIIEVSSDADDILQAAKMIASIDLTVTVRTAHDLFCEQIAELVIAFLVDLAACRLYNVPPEEETWIKQLIADKICGKPEVGYEGGDKSRFARFLLNDIKLWKDARDRLKSLYISLLALGQPTKLQLGILFTSVFPQLIEYNLLVDREPEHNILLFSLQIVTVPSVVVVLVTDHGFLKMILDLLYSFFTHQFAPSNLVHGDFRYIIYPPDLRKKTIDPEGMSFRHKRYYHLFHELNLILSSPGVQAAICHDTKHLMDLITFVDLFTNMNPNKRAANVHVEFESDAWVTAFNLTIQLAKLCKFFGECYAKASNQEFVNAIRVLVGHMLTRQYSFHEVQFGSALLGSSLSVTPPSSAVTYKCIDFRIDKEAVSFHHPINWLLAEILRHIHRIDFQNLDGLPIRGIADLFAEVEPPNHDGVDLGALIVSEDVLRVASLLAQVRAGLWVRNGFGFRAQGLHYREYSLRETTFDQDIYQLQVLLSAKDPSHVLVAIVDRFGLRQWCNGELLSDRNYEPSQMITMLEELLHLLIIILSEPAGVSQTGKEDGLRREIIHILCLSPMPYSDIIKRIPDRYMPESGFDQTLKALADFKQPSGINDVGIYSLKPEFYLEIDPYYCRFGRNQREEAEKLMVERLKKISNEVDPVNLPMPLKVNPGPFTGLLHTYNSEVLLQIIFYALARVNPTMKGYSEYLADQAIHLVMKALIEQPESFANMAVERKLPLKGANPHAMSLMMMLEAVDGEPAMKGVKRKVNWCLDTMTRLTGLPDRSGPKSGNSDSKSGGLSQEDQTNLIEDQKKEAAKARQAALMKQFAAAQQAFVMQNDLDEDSDEEIGSDEMNVNQSEIEVEIEKVHGNCILCQEDLTKSRCFGALGLIQSSRMIKITPSDLTPEEAEPWLQEVVLTPDSLDLDGRQGGPAGVASRQSVNLSETRIGSDGNVEAVEWHAMGFPTRNNTKFGLFTSACGHMMHLSCFQTYYTSIELRHSTQVTRNHPENPERCEYLCPLCKSIGNIFLPAIDPDLSMIQEPDEVKLDLMEWLSSIDSLEDEMIEEFGTASYTSVLNITNCDEIIPWFIHATLPEEASRLSSTRSEEFTMLQRFLMVSGALGRECGDTQVRPKIPRDLVAYTLQCNEISSRGQLINGGVMNALNETQQQLIRSLLAVMVSILEIETGCRSAKKFAMGLLMRQLRPPMITDNMFTRRSDFGKLPIIFTDPFSLVIHCAAICPEAFSLVMPLCYYIEVLRVLLGVCYMVRKYPNDWWKIAEDQENEDVHETKEEREREGKSLKAILMKVLEACKIKDRKAVEIDDLIFEKLIRRFTLPFLRRSAMLKSVILVSKNENENQMGSEHTRLRQELGVPSVVEILYEGGKSQEDPSLRKAEGIQSIMISWIDHLEQYESATSRMNKQLQNRSTTSTTTSDTEEWIDIFENEDMIKSIALEHSQRKCERCEMIPQDPGICLLCGTVVCVQAFCCTSRNLSDDPENGECNVHMWNCGGSIGLYLLIKKCSVLYLSTQNGTFTMAPYLDEHGEHDMGIKRGRPQFLHRVRWDEIRKIWLNQSIPTHVARRQEIGSDVGGWPTF
ncbi:uncharacterized protein MELLADRAFT_108006 [Melampsora larici-populina 98AG31]|uniref:E3 ubiquitin-protein ligase n=1 Tax=Melampsora larici-populina (strain 98AG31 / pathotype 3-4-7) TaxID=747676 RepID=F4RRN1_MELLP|nr:uncharacterized protein MELLADRAFT_108006 [Melampsora larici-populina 98AG31]EGG04954.1 hypothetical protein MELLADRAFT_108006 [Melampsora larici-populina 98AG31]